MKRIDLTDEYTPKPMTENQERYNKTIKSFKNSKREEEAEKFEQICQWDEKIKEEMIQSHLKFVVRVAEKYLFDGLELDDLVQEGNIGLCTAVEKYDETMWCKFTSFAVKNIQWNILNYISKNLRLLSCSQNAHYVARKLNKVSEVFLQKNEIEWSAQQIAELYKEMYDEVITAKEVQMLFDYDQKHCSIGQGDPGDNDVESSPIETLDKESLKYDIDRVLGTLTEREVNFLSLFFWLHGGTRFTLEEIGERYGYTRERVRQIIEKAIRRLRHTSRNVLLKKHLG